MISRTPQDKIDHINDNCVFTISAPMFKEKSDDKAMYFRLLASIGLEGEEFIATFHPILS